MEQMIEQPQPPEGDEATIGVKTGGSRVGGPELCI